jgi:cytochrome c-type biogenesis protein CcmH
MIAPILLSLLLLAYPGAGAEDTRTRVNRIEDSLLAPCCWQESVRRHMSEVAVEMRAEIERFVAQGKSDREILDYYKARYGRRVLIEPEGRTWWLAILVPIAFSLAALWFVLVRLRRMRAPASAAGGA